MVQKQLYNNKRKTTKECFEAAWTEQVKKGGTPVKPILIIDPGHGGKDTGGGSNKHWGEKDMTLKMSLYQYNRYKELGVPVAITRTTDLTLSPEERTNIVKKSGAKYCHSNHINTGGGDGAEVIHSIYSSGEMAEKIASEIKKKGQNIRRIFTRALPNNSTRDYYFMIRDSGSVITNIIEYGFADSPTDDVAQIRNSWEKYAEAVVKAFCEFAGFNYTRRGGSCKERTASSVISTPRWFTGKRVESKVENLRFYDSPSWEDKDLVNTIDKGIGFPTIVARIKVGNGYQYKVYNSKGETYYITASEKYVRVL